MMRSVIPFPEPNAEAHAHAETERKRRLFAWVDALLQQLGLTAKVVQAQSVDDLRKINLDVDDVELALAIRDALHPAGGPRAECFTGVNAGTLKWLLKKRLADMKKDREAELLGRTCAAGGQRASPHSWIAIAHRSPRDVAGWSMICCRRQSVPGPARRIPTACPSAPTTDYFVPQFPRLRT
jgi:hypothetical protein